MFDSDRSFVSPSGERPVFCNFITLPVPFDDEVLGLTSFEYNWIHLSGVVFESIYC